MFQNRDTIAAQATAAGEGGVAIVRVSGADCEAVVSRVFRAKNGKPLANRVLTYGCVMENGEIADEAMAVLMRAPHSYTRENVAEIHCHGSQALVRKILMLLMAAGARMAEPGEFTYRAFMNGRIDLAQAEGVMRMIRAGSERAMRSAVRQMEGGVSAFVRTARAEITSLLAAMAAAIDFPDEVEETQTALNRAVYAYAEQLAADGQKEAAATEFYSLGTYQDAADRGNALEYELAVSEREGDVHSALDRFEALGDYGDAAEQATRCRYLMARQAMDAGEYDEAIALYEACGAYQDAEDGAMQARYARAAAWFDAQEYDAAAKAFAELGSYEDAKQRVTASEDAWLSADYNSAKMDTEVGNYAAVIDELEPYYGSDLPARYAEMNAMYESACLMRAQELTALGRPLDALPILRRIEDNKTAKKRLEAYVYQIIGRWKDTRGTEYVFREDGSCRIAGEEGYFGGSGDEITVGSEPYPTTGAYSVVSVRGSTVTLRGLQSGKTIRLSYLGEATAKEETADNPEN